MRKLLTAVVAASVGAFVPAMRLDAALSDFPHVYNYDLNNDGVAVGLYGRLMQPTNYDPSKSYPLVVFYHGAGEKGTNNTSQVGSAINGLVAAAKERGFFVYAPQVNANAWYPSSIDASMRVVSQISKDFNIDATRTYVTGLSMGGSGTWNALTSYNGVFAAGVPTAAGLPNAGTAVASVLPGKHIWMFHSADDTTLAPGPNTRTMLNVIRSYDGGKAPLTSWRLNNSTSNPYYSNGAPYYTAASGTTYYEENNLRYTEYASGGHNSWSRAYGQSSMYDWLLAKKTDMAAPERGKKILFDFGSTVIMAAPDSQGRTWNSTGFQTETTLGTSVPFAADSTGRRTTVEITVDRKFAGNNNNTAFASEGAIYDAGIVGDGWMVGSTAGNATTIANPGILSIRGLTPGGEYRMELFASRAGDDGGRGYITRYIIGDEWEDLDVANNLTREAVFDKVVASADGVITLQLSVAPGTTRYGHLNALELTALTPEPGTGAVAALAATGLLARRRRMARQRARHGENVA